MRWVMAGCMLALCTIGGCKDERAPVLPEATPDAVAGPVAAPPPPHMARAAPDPAIPLGDDPPNVVDTRPVDTQILDVTLSDQGDGQRLTGRMTTQFGTADGVFLAIRTKGTAATYTLSSTWRDPGGKTLTEYSQDIATAGQVDTIFSMSRPDGWPAGNYSVALAINGRPMRTVPFQVR